MSDSFDPNTRRETVPNTTQPHSQRFLPAKVIVSLPAYNEEVALPELLERIGEAFADNNIPYEVVIVDDGSSDDTANIAAQMSFQMPIHLIQHEQNQGLGVTLRDGLREAVDRAGERDIIITMDADNTHPPGLINRMVQMIHEGCDVVIASRFESGGRSVGVPFERHLLSLGGRVLFTLLFPGRGDRGGFGRGARGRGGDKYQKKVKLPKY